MITARTRPYTAALERLKRAGLRPTRQRLALARLLFETGDRHVTAEQLHAEAAGTALGVSLATVYNALHQFTEAGLLRMVVVEAGRTWFDTNIADHHHFFFEATQQLLDIPASALSVTNLPEPPDGTSIASVEVIVRVRPAPVAP